MSMKHVMKPRLGHHQSPPTHTKEQIFHQSAAFKFLRTYFSDPKNILRETVAFNDSVEFAQLEMASPEYIPGFSLHVRNFGEERTKKFALQLCTWTCIRTCI